MPRQIRDTRRPVEPRLTYSMTPLAKEPTSGTAHGCGCYGAPGAASPGDNAPAPPGMPQASPATPAWMLAKAPVVIPIPGASRPESIIDSAQAPELALTPGELARLDVS